MIWTLFMDSLSPPSEIELAMTTLTQFHQFLTRAAKIPKEYHHELEAIDSVVHEVSCLIDPILLRPPGKEDFVRSPRHY